MSVWSLACQRSVFQRYHSEKHLMAAKARWHWNYVTVTLCIIHVQFGIAASNCSHISLSTAVLSRMIWGNIPNEEACCVDCSTELCWLRESQLKFLVCMRRFCNFTFFIICYLRSETMRSIPLADLDVYILFVCLCDSSCAWFLNPVFGCQNVINVMVIR